MSPRVLILAAALATLVAPLQSLAQGKETQLPTPGFHHLHLNSMNPDAAIDFYTRQFPSAAKSTFAGSPALKIGNAYVLFTKVTAPPPTQPQTAIWHFGWHVRNVHESLATYLKRKEVHLLPLYTTDEGGSVFVSSDTWPGVGGSLGATRAQIAEAKTKGIKPTGGAGFAYMEGPEGALVEYQGDMPAERFNHVHLFQKDPYCAELWYQKHLNAAVRQTSGRPAYTEDNCKVARPELSWPSLKREGMYRLPGGVTFDDVALAWHIQQDDKPLASSRGHLADHIALSIHDLDAWIAKLRSEGVKFLEQPYQVGGMRAVMIEGPSREALELIEVKSSK